MTFFTTWQEAVDGPTFDEWLQISSGFELGTWHAYLEVRYMAAMFAIIGAWSGLG